MNAPTIGGMFDGSGMLALGLHQAGLRHRWLCEADPWRRELLRQRFPGVPVYADVRDIDASCERVDGIAGGFPCKGVSTSGKRNGFDHAETVLWREMARAIRDLEPRFVVIENVANLLALADGALWSEVLGDLAALGFDVEWDVLPAAAVGAPHLRERVFAVARHPDRMARAQEQPRDGRSGPLDEPGALERAERPDRAHRDASHASGGGRREDERDVRSGEPDAARRGDAPADPDCEPGRDEPIAQRGRGGAPAARDAGQAAPDACGGRQSEQSLSNGADPEAGELVQPGDDAQRCGVRVEWGDYAAAVQRWEAVHGPAPEPLIRRMDDGPTDVRRLRARVDRSRLSALGDGVHVYVARLVGEHVMSLSGTSTQSEGSGNGRR